MKQYDHFKDKLHDYKVKVDKEKIWQNTSHAIPQRRKRRIILLFFTGMVLVSGLIGYTLRTPASGSALSANNRQLEPIAANETISTNPSAQTNLSAANEDGQIKTETLQEPQPGNQVVSSDQVKTRNFRNNRIELGTVNESSAEKQTRKANTTRKPDVIQKQDRGVTETHTQIAMPFENREVNPSADLKIHESQSQLTDEEVNPSKPSEVQVQDQTRSFMTPVSSIPGLDVPFSLVSNLKDQDGGPGPIIPADPLSKKISFSVLAAIGLSSFDVRSLNHEAKETADLFKQNVRSLEHLSLDFAGRLPLPQGFAVHASLGWDLWTTKTQNQTTSYQPFTREGVTNIVIDEHGVQQQVTGIVNGTQVIHTSQVRFTQYQTIDAGLSLYKNLWHRNRILVDVYAKGNVVLKDDASGSTYNTEGDLVKFSRKESPFKRKSPVGVGAGLNLHYQISRYLQIHSVIGFQPVKYLWQQNQQLIELTHSGIHGHLGMSYQL